MTQVAALPAPLEFTATLPVVVGHGDMVEGAGVGAWRLRGPVSIPREPELPGGHVVLKVYVDLKTLGPLLTPLFPEPQTYQVPWSSWVQSGAEL